ncbi:hypothetical protein QZH41_009768 [Actinostola sp. cb2023]|nr:hypothetical protein QZH41_009768 [Actinostola sp. cb2023]
MQEESSQINEQQQQPVQQQQPLQQSGPQTEYEVYEKITKMLEVEFSELTKVEEDLTDYADKLNLQRVMAEVSKIEELFSGKCEDEHCQEKRKIVHRSLESGVFTITYCCPNGHSGVWSSSSVLTKKRGQNVFVSTVLLSAGILITGNNFDKTSLLFKFLNCSFISKATYNRIQSLHAVPAIKELWTHMKEKVESVLKETTVIMCGDGRMDSPGFSAKYCVYSIMDHKLGVIIDIEVVDKREAGGSSTLMEKVALKRLIERLLEKFIIGELTTDASATIIKLIRDLKDMHRDKLEQLFHSLDIWHKSCKLTANLTKVIGAFKIKGNEAIKEWIEPIRNHFWHCAEISHGDENTLKDAWIGVVHHICGEHEWIDGSCAHGPLTNLESEKKCLVTGSKPFKAVQEIIFDKRWLTSLKYYVHTSQLESFNSMMLKYAPKRNAFSNEAFSARVELAALDNNFHLFRRVIPERGKKTYSKRSKNWKIQSVKEEKSYKYWLLLGSRILKRRVDDKEAVTRHIEVPANHPKNIAPSIAMRAAPPTEELLQAKRSRFHSKN